MQMDPVVRRRLDERIGVTVDRRVQDRTAEIVAIGAEIGAAAGQAEPQRNAGADRRARMLAGHGRSRLLTTRSGTGFKQWP